MCALLSTNAAAVISTPGDTSLTLPLLLSHSPPPIRQSRTRGVHLGDGACFGDCLPLLLCLGNLNPDLNEKVVIFYIDLLLDTFNGTTPINKCFIPSKFFLFF